MLYLIQDEDTPGTLEQRLAACPDQLAHQQALPA